MAIAEPWKSQMLRDNVTVRCSGTSVFPDDRLSTSGFTFLMVLFSLAETGGAPQAPVITVPAG